jgi:hypothetical protein
VTQHLDTALREFGFLAAMVRNLDAARSVWSKQVLSDIGMNQFNPYPLFADAYSDGATQLRRRTPGFFYGMCFVRAYGIFEHFLGQSMREIIRARPRILLSISNKEDRKLDYSRIVHNLQSPAILLDELIHRELNRIMRRSLEEILKSLRKTFGLSAIKEQYDHDLLRLSFIRNCIVHSGGRSDERLENHTQRFYRSGEEILLDRNTVSRSISIFVSFVTDTDGVVQQVHFS